MNARRINDPPKRAAAAVATREKVMDAADLAAHNARENQRADIRARIREARENADLSQDELAKRLRDAGVKRASRSAVAQWEREGAKGSNPPLTTMHAIAKILSVPTEHLALGLTYEPVVKTPDPKELGYVLVPEVVFGAGPDNVEELQKWGLPTDWLRADLNITSTDKLIMYKVPIDNGAQEFGDRIIVDRSSYRPSPPGNFLYWDGMGPAIARIEVIPGIGQKKITARVTAMGTTYEVEADKIQIIGRIRGAWRKA